ncbi:hypothetical protein [Streptosporangium sp. NPDC087985]|uniref:hypothetical protein n=1 Tax=Streptosporangium sp. NPDC087985 TaxID=3366196 RepID=UPI00381D3D94
MPFHRHPRAALRMVVLATRDLPGSVRHARERLGLLPGIHDPYIADLNLVDEVLTVGRTYLQLLAPVDHSSRVHRWLERKGGDAAYLTVIQTNDADGVVERCAQLGIRVSFDGIFDGNRVVQLDQRDLGMLVEIDEIPVWESWHWAPDVLERVSCDVVTEIVSVECVVPDPLKTANLLAAILGVTHDGQATLELESGHVRLVAGDRSKIGISSFDVRAARPDRVGETFSLCGTVVRFVA